MPDEKSTPDELTKTNDDDIKLTEAELNNVSGGTGDYYKIHMENASLKLQDKTSPNV